VFDNATDPAVLQPFIPAAGTARVIITSNRQSVAHLGASVPVEVFSEPDVEGLGVFDVHSYYPSITMEPMRAVMFDVGAPAGAVEVLTRIIGRLPSVGGVSGIPIGPESSALLGNVFLTPLDDALRPHGPFVRWTDDIWVFPCSDDAWEDLKEIVERTLDRLGLQLNDKVKYLRKGIDDPWHEIEHRQWTMLSTHPKAAFLRTCRTTCF
jgi:hypothetical protein